MTPTDVIIQIFSDYLPENARDEDYSYVGWDCNNPIAAFFNYADSYRYAADLLYHEFRDSKKSLSDLDRLGYAICYLYRQSIELSLKFIYMCTKETLANKKTFIKKGHNLVTLWQCLKPHIEKCKDKDWTAIDYYIKEFNKFDSNSMLMRYPVDKEMRPNKGDLKINIKIFVKAAKELQTKLMFVGEGLCHMEG